MRRDVVFEKLRLMHIDYERYTNKPEMVMGSSGLVVNYGSVGGGQTNRTSDIVAMQAIRNANVDPRIAEHMKWLECTWSVFERLLKQTEMRGKIMAYVLFHKAFLGWTYAKIAEYGLPNGATVSRQRIYQYFEKAVDEVALEAVKRGLLS